MANYTTIIVTLVLAVGGVLLNPRTSEGARLRMRDGLPVVEGVFVNGHGPFTFLVDTGSAMNQLEPSLAETLGLKPTFKSELGSSTTGWTFVLGSGGIRVAIDDTQADDQMFLFAGLGGLGLKGVQGLLGQEFLSRFDYLLDVKAQRLEFSAPMPSQGRGVRVPFTVTDGRPAVDTSLGRLVLDSGADALIRFNVTGGAAVRQMTTLTGTTVAGVVRSRLVINDRAIWSGDAVAVQPRAGLEADGLMPITLFARVYVSNSEGFLILD